jgi:hypothetical protein
MSARARSLDDVLATLASNPGRIADLISAAPDDLRRASATPGAWSALEIFAHVRACSDVWGGHIAAILDDGAERLRAGDPRAWAADHGYARADFTESFAAFEHDRAALLGRLRDLTDADWARTAVMVGASSRVERSVRWHADHIARHEAGHVTQIRRTLASGSGAAGGRPRPPR